MRAGQVELFLDCSEILDAGAEPLSCPEHWLCICRGLLCSVLCTPASLSNFVRPKRAFNRDLALRSEGHQPDTSPGTAAGKASSTNIAEAIKRLAACEVLGH